MTSGEQLYMLVVLVTFVSFAAVLAWAAQVSPGKPIIARHPEPASTQHAAAD